MFSSYDEQFDTFIGDHVVEKPNHAAEQVIDPKTDKKNRVTDMYWKMDGTAYGELSFRNFIDLAITEMKRRRRHGYVRLFLYPTEKAFDENRSKYFAIFIRKRDIYVVGIQSVDESIHEIGLDSENERYFFNSSPTGFGQQYSQLFPGTGLNGDLVGAWIGFHVLNQAILRVIRMTKPRDWAWSIGVFALTFSECIRFVWSLRKVSDLIDHRKDIRMDGKYKYLAKLTKEWTTISDCARRNLEPGAQPQPEAQKYTNEGLDDLKLVVQYACDSLHIKTWDYRDYHQPVNEEPEGGIRLGFGDGGGSYFHFGSIYLCR